MRQQRPNAMRLPRMRPHQELYETVGAAIRAARNADGLCSFALAKRVGCSDSHLQSVETGIAACSLHLLVAIAHELDTSLDALVPVNIDTRDKVAS